MSSQEPASMKSQTTAEPWGPFSLAGKRIWVLGGAGYLGRSVVQVLLQAGARVLCADLENRAYALAEEFDYPDNYEAKTLDVGDSEKLIPEVNQWMRESGVPDGLANLTFGATAKSFSELTAADFDQANHLNLTSTFILSRVVANSWQWPYA